MRCRPPALALALALATALVATLVTAACPGAPDDAGEGEGEGEGEAGEGEGEAGEGEGEAGEGEGEGEGEPPPPCPTPVTAAILICVQELRSDPEASANLFLIDLLLLCSDAEAVADDRDEYCANVPGDPACVVAPEVFFDEVVPACTEQARAVLFDSACQLPPTMPALEVSRRFTIVDTVALDPLALQGADEAQVIAAVRSAQNDDVTTAEEAFARADQGLIERVLLEDAYVRRALDAIVFAQGDTQLGAFFFAGTTTLLGVINDGAIEGCAVEQSRAGAVCFASENCPDAALTCIGSYVDEAVPVDGICVDLAPLAGEGDACEAETAPCPRASGLVCSAGLCLPAWTTASFADEAGGALPGVFTLRAAGLATVATFARASFFIVHEQIDDVRVSVRSPADAQPRLLFDGAVDAHGPSEVFAVDVTVPVPGDESVNGPWELVVEGPPGGTLVRWSLTLGSRFD